VNVAIPTIGIALAGITVGEIVQLTMVNVDGSVSSGPRGVAAPPAPPEPPPEFPAAPAPAVPAPAIPAAPPAPPPDPASPDPANPAPPPPDPAGPAPPAPPDPGRSVEPLLVHATNAVANRAAAARNGPRATAALRVIASLNLPPPCVCGRSIRALRHRREDYARRKEMPVLEVERWPAPNLGYDRGN
jgi:hypothetical protein